MRPNVPQPAGELPTLHLWFAYPDDLKDEGAAQSYFALLSDDERLRHEKFRFAEGRREYLAAHALLRTALSQCHPLPPEAWRFEVNAYGKPAIDPACVLPFHQPNPVSGATGLSFNLSHARALCASVVAPGQEIGVDVEACDRSAQILEVAARVFSAAELAQLESLPESQRPDRALSLWTLKEAYIKARGLGFSLPVKKVSFLFGELEGIWLDLDPSLDDDPATWRFCLIDHARHRIAIVARLDSDPVLKQGEMRPARCGVDLLIASTQQWFPIRADEARPNL